MSLRSSACPPPHRARTVYAFLSCFDPHWMHWPLMQAPRTRTMIFPIPIVLFVACRTPRWYLAPEGLQGLSGCRIYFLIRWTPSYLVDSPSSCFRNKGFDPSVDLKLVLSFQCEDEWLLFLDSNWWLGPAPYLSLLPKQLSVDCSLFVALQLRLFFHFLYCMKDALLAQLRPYPAQHRH